MGWTQEGKRFALEVLFSEEQSVPANYYIGLAQDASLAGDATLADLTEVTGTGYARQAVASSAVGFTSSAEGTSDWKQTTATVNFAASGTWDTAQIAFLCTVSSGTSGKLLFWRALAAARTLLSGEDLDYSGKATFTDP